MYTLIITPYSAEVANIVSSNDTAKGNCRPGSLTSMSGKHIWSFIQHLEEHEFPVNKLVRLLNDNRIVEKLYMLHVFI